MVHKRKKPTIVIDFDGTLHLYLQGWTSIDHIADGPTPGAMDFLGKVVEYFDVAIWSGRSKAPAGLVAMQNWLRARLTERFGPVRAAEILDCVTFPMEKPAARVTLDDRAIQFAGVWPSIHYLVNFKPWNHKMQVKSKVVRL